MWFPVHLLSDIPTNCDLRLAVIEGGEVHALIFPCRFRDGCWLNAATGHVVDVFPTHWQRWAE